MGILGSMTCPINVYKMFKEVSSVIGQIKVIILQ